MAYLEAWLGMREVGSPEPKPGVPPTTAHLADLVARMQVAPAKVIVYMSYNSPQATEFLSERTKIPAVMLPYTVGGSDKAKDLFGYALGLLASLWLDLPSGAMIVCTMAVVAALAAGLERRPRTGQKPG